MDLGLSSLNICRRQKLGAPPFSPSTVAGLTCWADPSNLSTMTQSSVSGGAVTASGQVVGTVASSSPATVGWSVSDANRFIITQAGSLWYLAAGSIGWGTSGNGGGSTTGFFFIAGADIGSGFTDWLYSEHTTASPNIGYDVWHDGNTNTMKFSAGNGTARTTCTSGSTMPPIPTGAFVVMCWDDGVNLNCQINNGTVGTIARPTVSAGSLNPFVGSPDGTTTNSFNGKDYGIIWAKNSALTASDRANLKTWMGQKCGLTL